MTDTWYINRCRIEFTLQPLLANLKRLSFRRTGRTGKIILSDDTMVVLNVVRFLNV